MTRNFPITKNVFQVSTVGDASVVFAAISAAQPSSPHTVNSTWTKIFQIDNINDDSCQTWTYPSIIAKHREVFQLLFLSHDGLNSGTQQFADR